MAVTPLQIHRPQNRSQIRRRIQRLLQQLALAWLRHELDRRASAALRDAPGAGGQVFRAFIQINLAPRSR